MNKNYLNPFHKNTFILQSRDMEIKVSSRVLCDTRVSWDEYFMRHAELASTRSTCVRMKTGAVLVREHRIISEGYNGTVAGAIHCDDHWFGKFKAQWMPDVIAAMSDEELKNAFATYLKTDIFSTLHHHWSTNNEIHGEQNCILFATRHGIATDQTRMYTMFSPCINCAKVIVAAGITSVVFRHVYARDTKMEGIKFLEANGITVVQLE